MIHSLDIRAEITNAVKNTAAILLDKTSSTLPIFNSLYNCGPANVMLEYYDPQKNHLNKALAYELLYNNRGLKITK